MSPVSLVTDSASDIPYKTLDELGVRAVPLTVHIGDDTFPDSDLTIDRFWELASDPTRTLATSQPSVGAFAQMFRRLVDQGHEVVCVVISSRISGTFNSAWLAAREFGDRVTVFDSGFWSVAQGYQIKQAAAAIARGSGWLVVRCSRTCAAGPRPISRWTRSPTPSVAGASSAC